MQTMVQGILTNPSNEPVPMQEIRITTGHTESTVRGTLVTYSTDDTGNYSFPLLYGTYNLEVLVSDEYKLVGDLIVDESTPDPIELETLVLYSPLVQPRADLDFPQDWDDAIQAIEDNSQVRARDVRQQIVDNGNTTLELDELDTVDHLNTRLIRRTVEHTSGDAHIQHLDLVLTDDDDGKKYVSTGSVVESENASHLEQIRLETGELVRIDTDTASGITVDSSRTISGSYTDSEAVTAPTTSSLSSVSHTDSNIAITDSQVSDDVIRKVLTVLSDNGVDQAQLMRVVQANQTNGVEISESATVKGKTSHISHTNTGSDSKVNLLTDTLAVTDGSNDILEVDTVNNRVYVRGQLRVSQLEDGNGNPIDPSDGDTIFLTYEYSENAFGPWHDTRLPTDDWARQTFSRNGVLDPWGSPYQINPTDGTDGDTIYWEYQYSIDGIGNWHSALASGDVFRRERRVVDGTPETWSNPARIKGDDGSEIEIRSEYSIDGVFNWHDVLDPLDRFQRKARFVDGAIDTPWSNPFPIGQGKDAISQVTLFLYQRGLTAPASPIGDLVYNFPNQTLTGNLNNWERSIPAGTGNIYTALAVASSTTDVDTIEDTEWNIQRWSEAGYNSASVYLYQRGLVAPLAPDTDLTWDFATGRFTNPDSERDGWEYTIPAGVDPIWICLAQVYSNTPTDIVAPNEWQIAQQGSTGLNQANLLIFARGTTAPAAPTGTVTYTFGTGQYTGLSGGWSPSPAAGVEPLWVGSATAISYGVTDDVQPNEWDVARWTESGFQGARIDIYQSSPTQPTILPANGSVYSYEDGTLTFVNANGWQATVPTNSDGKLWVATVLVTAFAGVLTEVIDQNQWATPVLFLEDGYQSHPVTIYHTADYGASAPTANTGNVTYTFATDVATGSNNGWSPTYPTVNNGGVVWFQRGLARAISSSATDVIPAGEFSSPEVLVQDGRETITVSLYALDTTSKFTGNCNYNKTNNTATFPTDAGTPWSTEYPASPKGTQIYIITAAKLASDKNDVVVFNTSEFSNPIVIGGNGQDGSTGVDGDPGPGWYYIEGNNGVFPADSVAVSDMVAKYGRVPTLDDHLFYVDNEADPTATDGKRCISPWGTPVGNITFADPAIYIDGDMIVKGTLSADRILAKSISGNEVSSSTTMIAGSGSWTAGMNGDDSASSGVYKDYRFWSGSETPASAPFRVDKTGAITASNATINGSVTATSGRISGTLYLGTGNDSSDYCAFYGAKHPNSNGEQMRMVTDGKYRLRQWYTGRTIWYQSNGTSYFLDINPANNTAAFYGTVYAQNIAGDIVTNRRYSAADKSAGTSWVTYDTCTVSTGRPYARSLVIRVMLSVSAGRNVGSSGSYGVGGQLRVTGSFGTQTGNQISVSGYKSSSSQPTQGASSQIISEFSVEVPANSTGTMSVQVLRIGGSGSYASATAKGTSGTVWMASLFANGGDLS